jgi:uncharacterized membrane protein YphA (DoxX/SURF4 family)
LVLALSIAQDAMRALGAFDRSGHGAYLAFSIALTVLCLPVAVGFLAPIVHVIAALVESATIIVQGSVGVVAPPLAFASDPRILQASIAVALAMLGPGVYSVDSHLFGRHEIVIRPRAADAESRARK